MPSVDLRSVTIDRRPANGALLPESAQSWNAKALHQTTARIQRALRTDCADLLANLRMTPEVERELRSRIEGYLTGDPSLMVPGYTVQSLTAEVFEYVAGLGPLQKLIQQPEISEIMVNRYDDIWIEVGGRMARTELTFRREEALRRAMDRIFQPLGISLSTASPIARGRLPGNIRVCAAVPPVRPHPTMQIRKMAIEELTPETYIGLGSAHPAQLAWLELAFAAALNVIIAGPTGTGKTTLLRLGARSIPREMRVLVLELVAELGLELYHPHVVNFEVKSPNPEGQFGVSLQELVEFSLHCRPDYLIVGEVLGPEAVELLKAMATGHPGASTIHAESPAQLFNRLALAMIQARLDINFRDYLHLLADAIDLVFYIERERDGTRRITHVSEILGYANGITQLRDLWVWDPLRGTWRAVADPSPALVDVLARRGYAPPEVSQA